MAALCELPKDALLVGVLLDKRHVEHHAAKQSLHACPTNLVFFDKMACIRQIAMKQVTIQGAMVGCV